MRSFSIIALAGALAACGSNPSDDAETTPEEQGQMTEDATLDDKALAALQQCEQVEPTCAQDGESYLVFPDVTSVALGIGGEGGEGALIRNGQVVDYYNMGEASIGLQAGVSAASYVFKMPNQEALAEFEDDGEWSIGAESSLVIANADANAAAETAGGQTVLYVFNAEGLMADVSVDAMRIWKDENSASDENMETGMTETTDS